MDPALRERIDRLPTEPGVYLMRDRRGKVVYVGKAANLRSRVRSYFNRSGDDREFVHRLAGLLGDVETVVVRNDKDALLLENQLIKRHQPRFNVKLKDDKNYLSIRIDPSHPWPRAELTRRIRQDGARYFGPYESATAIRRTVRVLNRHFQLRTCSDRVLNNRGRPCMLYQIKRCPAPCVYDVDRGEYDADVAAAVLFLEGRRGPLLDGLRERMRESAEELNFERAAQLRDQIAAAERVLVRQEVVFTHGKDEDIFGFARGGDLAVVQILSVRDGHVRDSRRHPLKGVQIADADAVSSFVNLFYDRGAPVPHRVVVPMALEDAPAKEAWLSELRGSKVEVIHPKRGPRRRLMETACRNAALVLEEAGREEGHRQAVLDTLAERLRLREAPRIIDCADISLFQGSEPVGSVVRFVDALPHTDGYRRYQVKRVQGTDDFAMMHEVLTRHLRRRHAEEALPDLLVVDGGKGQLNVALAAMRDVGIEGLPAVGLAKSRVEGEGKDGGVVRSPERIFLPGAKDPLVLRQTSPEIHLLARIRDEAHRFAITYHRSRRKKRTLRSVLDDIPGVGPARRRALLRAMGSVDGIRAASVEDLTGVNGVGPALAAQVLAHLGATP